MAAPDRTPRTSKQISERYRGNLDYLRRPHVFRTARLLCFVLAAVGSIAAAVGFRYYGKKSFFNTGPLSANHARFMDRCEVCHQEAEPDLIKALQLDRALTALQRGTPAGSGLDAHQKQAGNGFLKTSLVEKLHPKNWQGGVKSLEDRLQASTSLEHIDKACMKCHEPQSLHQPQMAALALRPAAAEISLAHAGSCSVCHREHQGPEVMKLPPSNTCESCHGSKEQMRQTFALLNTPGKPAEPKGEVRDFGDGLRRFIPPRETPHQLTAFKGFSQGHPAFGYEQANLRDPAMIRYNHQRHMQPDIPVVNGHKLDCADCHKPGADGRFMQRITYADNCAQCHSLQFDPDVPQLAIPHRDPEKVRDFLRSLTTQYVDFATRQGKITDRAQLQEFVNTQFAKLRARGLTTADELEHRVFFTGDPPEDPDRIAVKSNKAQFFPACAKCHEVEPATGGAPRIAPTNMAERWLTRGPFTHAPHQHMSCIDCHGAAKTSSRTSDILMPKQQLCAACHRPLDSDKTQPIAPGAEPGNPTAELAARQRREGGIAAGCQSCHPRYHAPAEAVQFIKMAEKK